MLCKNLILTLERLEDTHALHESCKVRNNERHQHVCGTLLCPSSSCHPLRAGDAAAQTDELNAVVWLGSEVAGAKKPTVPLFDLLKWKNHQADEKGTRGTMAKVILPHQPISPWSQSERRWPGFPEEGP